ncbi:MAG TPA: TonB-dependent receptor [Steroidobacteraceae bacterium]|jgi:iron complex outermembrane receptor protein|nr:TonB-dependent receptor [Steroidobacteraceae bacterium]
MNRYRVVAALSAAIGLSVLGTLSCAAWAQDANAPANSAPAAPPTAPADQGPAAAAGSGNQLQEVVVTAERRATDVMSTAISVDAVSGAALSDKQMVTVSDLQLSVPDYQVNQTGLYDSINIRGIGNNAITPTIQPGVAVFHDGLLAPETVGIDTPFYDIADTEVLRGPQGTLVSAASTGGSVQINSNDPNFRGINGYVEGLIGNYSDNKLDGAINLPVNDTFAARVAFNVEKRGSFYKDQGSVEDPGITDPYSDPGQIDQENVRLSFLWKPSDNYNLLLKIEDNYSNPGGQAGEPNQATFAPITSGGVALPCPNGANAAGRCYASAYATYGTGVPYLLNFQNPLLEDKQTERRYNLDQHFTLPDGIVLRSLTGYQRFGSLEAEDFAYSSYTTVPNQPFYDNTGPHDDYYSEDLSIISPTGGRLSYIAGADWFYRYTPVEIWIAPTNAVPLPGLLVAGEIDASAITEGLFGNIDYKVTNTLTFDIGLRGNWDEFFNRGYNCTYIGACNFTTPTANISYTPGNTRTFKDNPPTGKVGLNWQPSDANFFYAFFARGYKPGNYNTTALGSAPAPELKPEHVNDWELGWKGKLLDNHLQMQLGGFYMNYQDMQFTEYYIPDAASIPFNVGSSTIDGLEFSLTGKFGGFGTDVNAAYLHSRIGDVPAQVASYQLPGYVTQFAQKQCAGGEAPSPTPGGCFDFAPYTYNLSGEVNPYSPKLTASIDLTYTIALGNDELTPRVSFSHTDKQYGSLFQTDNTQIMGARNLLDAALTFNAGPWELQVFGNNLTNQFYLDGIGGGGSEVYYGAPRTFGLHARRDF